MNKYKTKLHIGNKDTYVIMLAAMAANVGSILEDEKIEYSIIPTSEAPDDVSDTYTHKGRIHTHALGVLKSKVVKADIEALVKEIYG